MTLPLNTILYGDAIEKMNSLPENSVDLIFADPPYNLQLQKDLWRPNMTKVEAVNDEWDKFSTFEQYDHFTKAWLKAARRVLKNTGTIWVIGSYHNIYRVGSILQDLGYWILNDILWIKSNPMPNFRGVRFANAHETLLWAKKDKDSKYTFNHFAMKGLNGDKQMRSDWTIPICKGRERIKINGKRAHATQKPEALLYRVISSSSKPGDVVLDPFFGSGTTGAVAKKLHRNWIGIEREETYIQIAQERIDAIEIDEYQEDVYLAGVKTTKKRIPFGTLLTNGSLRPGERLWFGKRSEIHATILANGHIQHDGTIGSIHKIAKRLKNAPCNGWDYWYYEENGERKKIDELRKRIREEMVKKVNEK
ncbi:MAG: site-specific DNA-methyltransferase [Chloroflexi bacterium]|nr:site-specific DNA-methyltransferase [Chloroflexota bacterium]